MNGVPKVIEGKCIDQAWCRYLLHVLDLPDRRCSPAIVSINCLGHDCDDSLLGKKLDEELLRHECYSTAITAMTIFPKKVWLNHKDLSLSDFCELCVRKFAPRLKALHPANRNGLYFERMMGYDAVKNGNQRKFNQLEHVIDRLNGDKKFRVTGLQISCFDPGRDHTAQPQRGFPCLQQIGVDYDGDDAIAITAFYPAHNVFDRAYGNFLGLIHLGQFISSQTGLRMARLNCYSMSPRLGKINRRDAKALADEAKFFLESQLANCHE